MKMYPRQLHLRQGYASLSEATSQCHCVNFAVWGFCVSSEVNSDRAAPFQPVSERRQHLTKIDLPGLDAVGYFFSNCLFPLSFQHTHPAWKSVKKIHSFVRFPFFFFLLSSTTIFPLFPNRSLTFPTKKHPEFRRKLPSFFAETSLRRSLFFWHWRDSTCTT